MTNQQVCIFRPTGRNGKSRLVLFQVFPPVAPVQALARQQLEEIPGTALANWSHAIDGPNYQKRSQSPRADTRSKQRARRAGFPGQHVGTPLNGNRDVT